MELRNNNIRAVALGLVYRNDDILVQKLYNGLEKQAAYKLLGGGIEFQEKSVDTLSREFKEEIAANVTIINYKGLVENIFEFENQKGHQIALIYEVKIDAHFYTLNHFIGDENGEKIDVEWVNKYKFIHKELILYPTDVLDLI